MLSVIVLSVVILSVSMLSVVALMHQDKINPNPFKERVNFHFLVKWNSLVKKYILSQFSQVFYSKTFLLLFSYKEM